MMNSKRNVFLIVNIPTHVRVLLGVADLLKASGEYVPHLVYFPADVFDQNHERCAESGHPSLLWRGGVFVQAEFGAKPADGVPAASKLVTSMPRFLYVILKPLLGPAIRRIYPNAHEYIYVPLRRFSLSVLSKAAKSFEFARGYLREAKMSPSMPTDHQDQSSQNRAREIFLAAFARVWEADSARRAGESRMAFWGRRLLEEGVFPGIGAQKRFHRAISSLLERFEPSQLIFPEENLFYFHHLWVHAARSRDIATAIVPFTIVNSLEWAEAFSRLPEFQADRGWNRLLAKAFPDWVLHHRGRRLVLPSTYAAGCEYLQLKFDRPWVINSGPIEVLCSESQLMSDYYRRAGIRDEKIVLTGALSDDRLFSILENRLENRNDLARRLGRGITGKVVLIALPPDQFVGKHRAGCEFARYDDLIAFMVDECKKLLELHGGTLLISLHPRINPADVAYLEKMGAIIVHESVENLVPLCDLYIAVVSATIRLAISCGIPVINYDAYQYHYDDYTEFAGVKEVRTKDAYKAMLAASFNDDEYKKMQKEQQETTHRLCALDGKAGQRLLGALKTTVAHRI